MRRRWMRIVGGAFAAGILVLLLDLLIPRTPFRFLGEFGFERGPTSTHGFHVGTYRARVNWASVIKSARSELEADGFRENPGDGRLTFRRGSGASEVTVYISRDAKTAELSREHLTVSFPGWVAVYVKGIDQGKLLWKLLFLFP